MLYQTGSQGADGEGRTDNLMERPAEIPVLGYTDELPLLREEYAWLDAGSAGLVEDKKKNAACRCDEVLMGKRQPRECPLFGKVCTPLTPQGACMVSTEGSCFSFFANR